MSTREAIDPLRLVARVTIECETPMLIGSGNANDEADKLFVRDIHGLPMIPASSIAGVLRHAFARWAAANGRPVLTGLIFGADQDDLRKHGGRLRISDGLFHDATDHAVTQRVERRFDADDRVCAVARTGLHRDRVRIDSFGTADGDGKFDALHSPKGSRFTFELDLGWGAVRSPSNDGEVEDPGEDAIAGDRSTGEEAWDVLLALLAHPATRFGSSVRSGLGTFSVERIDEAKFWLPKADSHGSLHRKDSDLRMDAFLTLGPSLAENKGFSSREPGCPDDIADALNYATITLSEFKPEDTWIVGGQDAGADHDADMEIDMSALREPAISWDGKNGNNKGSVSLKEHVATAAGIKGALAHRTLWHLNRIQKNWVGTGSTAATKHPELAALFGDMKRNAGEDPEQQESNPGRLFFQDVYISEGNAEQVLVHNVSDRFTAGVRPGLLFDERPVHNGAATGTSILIDLSGNDANEFASCDVREAFHCALEDLKSGWLQLGGGAGRGHGAFMATIEPCPRAAQWLKRKEVQQ